VRATPLPQGDKVKIRINVKGDGQEGPSHTCKGLCERTSRWTGSTSLDKQVPHRAFSPVRNDKNFFVGSTPNDKGRPAPFPISNAQNHHFCSFYEGCGSLPRLELHLARRTCRDDGGDLLAAN
jgi:hypothetical protein